MLEVMMMMVFLKLTTLPCESVRRPSSRICSMEGNADEILRWVVLEYKAYGLKTDTELGAFANGTTEKTYYQGYNSHYENTDPSTVSSNPVFNTHDGIYYGDSASQYAGMNTLEDTGGDPFERLSYCPDVGRGGSTTSPCYI